ncbi:MULTISPECIES: dTDP-4-dehydrorhamnose 3,5-epimerase [Pseudomonas]|jgi:dTDP-4-dehydrorhamnose 3,5-epimerase|uniref:dTDP-4-dehydrorhamnose 3,5-epimerase n=1 Tax=Pseudomonas TaxID=286 RepID=UPI00035807A9|nr:MULTISPECIES: dTDP-4-dehydrorhamnose 3,5-epimerase [Pseudomonas]EPJ93130.1 dTDP-4-dehydrorhamnose 3,5-epimerase [Pseudomonas psychrophila]MDY7584586.1 dTDP-4-dehydrorhamnose 3,5-epimerase [Pseudomonas sp. CCI3.1]MEB0070041.1 dTDP-4-dehydrorhamnose 3,5-epimerase [Pseudomonas sp. CCI3.1]MEB0072164.1 dTDP-4-dehydrorhamnose 3,5-epimerase [Pseudomonas sp. CCI1.4]
MKITRTNIPDVLVIEPVIFKDSRGWFMETFNERDFYKSLESLNLSMPKAFVQDNHSCSSKSVLRGLHFQAAPYAQGKLVRVVRGAAYDVVVDIRKSSKTYLQWFGIELNCSNNLMLWIPEGFAHGFVALENDTHFLYKTTDYYHKDSERTILWSDPALNIKWPDLGGFKISDKDSQALTLESVI